ncbi:hypothetical protein NC991_27730 [Funiculus sociatus GB1-A4]
MFRYFSRLSEKFNVLVYPVVVFSHTTPKTPEPNVYLATFPNKVVLQFNYDAIQLN